MRHLILTGACYLDTILTVPHFPEEDSKLRATSMQVRRGGNCPNTLEVLQQLLPLSSHPPRAADEKDTEEVITVTPHLIACLPNAQSTATRKIKSSFAHAQRRPDTPIVDLSRCLYRREHDEAASSYIIRSGQTGSRTIVNFNDLPDMTVAEFQDIADNFAREHGGNDNDCWWHFEGRIPDTTLRCIQYLRQAQPACTISVEVEKPGRQGLVELAAESDVVFYSRSWAEGASALSLPSGEYMHCPANPSGKDILVVDTIGAGDTFIAGMLYGLICHNDDWSRREMLAFAVELATSKVQRDGFAGLVAAQGCGLVI
ncbi:Ribokinase-like protein [Bombardia bombarda]|uniref:Ribokinase-like protein n=1 Tax=Bombardia bombarda TaxID=252184 RepID=A0AA40BW62_9PEZI|nr:Ribokinase-like protein [Bombardia bombarda]